MSASTEFVRYFGVSVIALFVDMLLFVGGIRFFEMSWMLASTIGFVGGVAIAYHLSIHQVFDSRRMKDAPKFEFLIFAGIGLAGLALTQMLLWLFIEVLHFGAELSRLASAALSFVVNFSVRKLILFSKKKT